MTTDHLRLILESEFDTTRSVGRSGFCQGRKFLQTWWQCFGWGASQLCKSQGGVRGIFCGDILRRLVARTIAQKITPATSPFQFPFVLQFDSQPSQFLWTDDFGDNHVILQGRGGEKGDALTPMLYSLGQHEVLQEVQDSLKPDEYLFVYIVDIYVVCPPARVRHLQAFGSGPRRERENPNASGQDASFERRCRLKLNVWTPHTRVCRGEGPSHEQGVPVLGDPLRACRFFSGAAPVEDRDVQGPARTPLVGARFAKCVVVPPLQRKCQGHIFVCVESRFQKLLILQRLHDETTWQVS